MPDKRTHRGAHPQDAELFAEAAVPRLQCAVGELSWLLSRGYAHTSALKLVGDRHALNKRQRTAVMRSACSDAARACRAGRCLELEALAGQRLHIDGYNLITTVEAALAGGVLLRGRDGCLRDMASMHGSYRKVVETVPAIDIIGRTLEASGAAETTWYLDRPVSNSGRLKLAIEERADGRGWPFRVRVVPDPDKVLAGSTEIVVTADSAILDRCGRWSNLALEVVSREVADAWLLELAAPAAGICSEHL